VHISLALPPSRRIAGYIRCVETPGGCGYGNSRSLGNIWISRASPLGAVAYARQPRMVDLHPGGAVGRIAIPEDVRRANPDKELPLTQRETIAAPALPVRNSCRADGG
jgi:hypothetical protein